MHLRDYFDGTSFRWRLREGLSRPENVIALIITCGFLANVQQGTDTNTILRDDPLIFKGIRVLTILLGGLFALSTVMRRRIPYAVCLAGVLFPLTLYFCCCVLSVPFSAYPLLSLFKAGEIGLVVLVCLIGITSAAGGPSDFFHLNIKIVLLYNVIVWVESVLFPGLAWVPLRGETPLFGHALSGVFPVINGNTVGLFGAVLFLAYLPKLCEPVALDGRPCLAGRDRTGVGRLQLQQSLLAWSGRGHRRFAAAAEEICLGMGHDPVLVAPGHQ